MQISVLMHGAVRCFMVSLLQKSYGYTERMSHILVPGVGLFVFLFILESHSLAVCWGSSLKHLHEGEEEKIRMNE